MKSLILILLCMFAFSAQAFAKIYVNGIDAAYAPFAYVDEESGKPAGFDVEALDWIAKSMGFGVTHAPIARDAMLPSLLARKIDMICSGMIITMERAKQVAFSVPYRELYTVFVVKKESDLTVAAILTEKLKLGGQRGTNEAESLVKEQKEKKLRFEVRLYNSAPQMIEDLISGRIHAALMDSAPAQDAVSRGKPLRIAGRPRKSCAFRRGLPPGRHGTANAGERRLQEIDGRSFLGCVAAEIRLEVSGLV